MVPFDGLYGNTVINPINSDWAERFLTQFFMLKEVIPLKTFWHIQITLLFRIRVGIYSNILTKHNYLVTRIFLIYATLANAQIEKAQ